MIPRNDLGTEKSVKFCQTEILGDLSMLYKPQLMTPNFFETKKNMKKCLFSNSMIFPGNAVQSHELKFKTA